MYYINHNQVTMYMCIKDTHYGIYKKKFIINTMYCYSTNKNIGMYKS